MKYILLLITFILTGNLAAGEPLGLCYYTEKNNKKLVKISDSDIKELNLNSFRENKKNSLREFRIALTLWNIDEELRYYGFHDGKEFTPFGRAGSGKSVSNEMDFSTFEEALKMMGQIQKTLLGKSMLK